MRIEKEGWSGKWEKEKMFFFFLEFHPLWILAIVTLLSPIQNRSAVAIENLVLKFFRHNILLRPTFLIPTTFPWIIFIIFPVNDLIGHFLSFPGTNICLLFKFGLFHWSQADNLVLLKIWQCGHTFANNHSHVFLLLSTSYFRELQWIVEFERMLT